MSSLLHLASHDSHEIGLRSRHPSFIPSLSQRGMMMISGGRKVGISEHSQSFIYQIPSLFDLKFLTFVTGRPVYESLTSSSLRHAHSSAAQKSTLRFPYVMGTRIGVASQVMCLHRSKHESPRAALYTKSSPTCSFSHLSGSISARWSTGMILSFFWKTTVRLVSFCVNQYRS
jgi:hypothetical protein